MTSSLLRGWGAIGVFLAGSVGGPAWADDSKSVSPYIDQLKREMPDGGKGQSDSAPDPYIESIKKKLKQKDQGSGFIDQIKKDNPTFFNKQADGTYLDSQKAKLAPADSGGAIQAVTEGHSQLHARMLGEPHAAFGFGLAAIQTFNPTSGTIQDTAFTRVYTGHTYNFNLLYNKTLWNVPLGVIEINGQFGATYSAGNGPFQFQLVNYNVTPNTQFSLTSGVGFQFVTFPGSIGLDYRMTSLKYIQPYISVGPELYPFVEFRSDGNRTHYGDSREILAQAGVWVQLDWISKAAAWYFYEDYSIHHYYLTVLYQNVTNISGAVSFASNSATVIANFNFEY